MSVKKTTTDQLANAILCALFAALIAVGAFIKVPIPYVPFTMQSFFVLLAGLLLGAKYGSLSAAIYLLIGLFGVPVFTEGGGFGYVLKPTFGYIIGFVVEAFLTGLIAHKKEQPSFGRLLAASFAGLLVMYAFGMVWFYMIMRLYMGKVIPIPTVLVSCFLVFLPGNGAGCFVGAALAKRLLPVLSHLKTTRFSKSRYNAGS